MTKQKIFPSLIILSLLLITLIPASSAAAPAQVNVAGNFESLIGGGDWSNNDPLTDMTYRNTDGLWKYAVNIPTAGTYEYKIVEDADWNRSYPASNVPFTVVNDGNQVSWYYDQDDHTVADTANGGIAAAVGSFQSEIGCPDDWQPDCLAAWLKDPDGDGIYRYKTGEISAGSYEAKVAHNESWDENYGAGGEPNGPNIPFTVQAGATVFFDYELSTHILTIQSIRAEDLVRSPVRIPAAEELFYMVLPDRFDNGDTANDAGGNNSGDPLVHGFLPNDKGYYHGGDILGLMNKLGYLDDLGVTAIWMTPQFTNSWVQGDGTISGSSAGYHGYWQIDYTQIDPHFGTNQEMKDLIDAAHSLGMKVFFDAVINHTGDIITYEEGVFTYRDKADYPYLDANGAPFDDLDYAGTDTFPPLDPAISFPYTPVFSENSDATAKNPVWLNNPIYYHNRGNSTFTGENSLYGDFFGLDDLFTEHPEVVEGMIDIHKNMITEFQVDGFRLDTVKHVNDEFWQAFVPEILAHAQAEGISNFFLFGEVFDGDPAYTSRYTTQLPFPSVLDFGFDGAAKAFAAASQPTDNLHGFFVADDYFTDSDSNAYGLVKFIGGHDIGRLGYEIDKNNPGASDSERVARSKLAYALMFFSRGVPLIYYGDEQGFTGDGGDKDARQDMMPSQVPTYNDDNLIGTSATTADANFDQSHELYQSFSEIAQLRDAHFALGQGAQFHRYSEGNAGIYAFSRVDRSEQIEYIAAFNNSESVDSASFTTATPNTSFTELYPGAGPSLTSTASGEVTVSVPALDFVIYQAESTIPTSSTAPTVSFETPAEGSDVSGRVEIAVGVSLESPVEVTFGVSIDGGEYQIIGTDDNAPYRVFYDVDGLPVGTPLTFAAVATNSLGMANVDIVSVVVGVEKPPRPDRPYAVIHYFRDDGEYGDHTTGDYNDFWGLHLWGDIQETIDWTSPKPFLGEDDYGRFAWVKLAEKAANIGFIVHKGDAKDGTNDDRFFDPSVTPEIWLRQANSTIFTSQADAQGFVTVRYHRDDGDYGDPTSSDYNDFWGLHLWGDAVDPSETTDWTNPKAFDGVDDYGAFWKILVIDTGQPVNFIIHRGDSKDPGPDESFLPAKLPTVWKQSGDEAIYPSRGAAENVATIHYHRDDEVYGDNASPDYNDFWGLHVWDGALNPNPSWPEPLRWSDLDVFGPVFKIDLDGGTPGLAYIIHRGDAKDPGPDQFLSLDPWGYEVWQLEGQGPIPDQAHYVLPVLGERAAPGDISKQQAHWVAADTIVWAAAGDPSADYRLYYAPTGGMTLGAVDIEGGSYIELNPGTPFPAGVEGYFHLAGLPTLKFNSGDLGIVPEILKGQLAVQATKDSSRLDATGLQIPGVLDDLYTYNGELGVTWDGEVPTIKIWAPTAKSVVFHLFENSDPAASSTATPMILDAPSGVWSILGSADWKGKYYLYEVEVYVHSTGQAEHNLVTDPYSISLATNSTRSQIVNLGDLELMPAEWTSLTKPPLEAPEDISIYEIHVRDFSVNDPLVPEEYKGTYKAFTLENTYGIDHLKDLQAAGLSHLHLLPVFDIATINENKAEWQNPDSDELATYPPDSDQQQALVTAVEDLDGFNWGYDPWHYTTPEGSYSTNPDGSTRIVEFREMVQSLNQMGLRVIMDVVYNHTNSAGQDEKSVLDRVVPGYYHRLNDQGLVETSTCCQNTASEHNMMEKLMIDSLVTWAKQYKVDAFRFDLMGHHMKSNMLNVRAALDALTLEADGVDGSQIYLYGEGWNFGEVADNARGVNATQLNMAGTGIGTFSDRLRDAVRGGGPFDSGLDIVRRQGFANGLFYDPNELNTSPEPVPEPSSVTIAGSLQSELGCPGDWQPECSATHLTLDDSDRVWQSIFTVPAGNWEYKAALNSSWDENYGANGEANGPNISLNLGANSEVKFYYSHDTHWVTDNINEVIATVPGSFQSEIGCPGDWQPDCLRSWLQDPEGDSIYSFSTSEIPPGSYEAKVAIDEDWAENYGAGGEANGPNIPFTVGPGQTVLFSYDAVSHVLSITYGSSDQLTNLLHLTDQIRVGMAGNLADYEFVDRNGNLVTGKEVDYNGQPTGYTQDPQEDITYISKHDNQTLYDNNTYKMPFDVNMEDRVRAQNVGLSTVLLGQGVPFVHAGSDLLRSKSFDRDSYNSGDWFNKLDFSYQENNFGVGLPVAGKNADNWFIMEPLLADPSLKPGSSDIEFSAALFQELLAIRESSQLFRLETEEEVQARVEFHNTGPAQLPGLIVMSISDKVGPDLDRRHEAIYVLVNANDESQSITLTELGGARLSLHPVQMASVDPVVRTAEYKMAVSSGSFTIPGRTTAVFIELASPQEQIGYLIGDVENLVDQGFLNNGQGNALIVKLEGAVEKLDAGQPYVAINQLNAFINQVKARVRGGDLSAEQGQYLIDTALDIIWQIEAGI